MVVLHDGVVTKFESLDIHSDIRHQKKGFLHDAVSPYDDSFADILVVDSEFL